MFPVKHTVIYTFFAITSVQNTCFCSVFNALASKNPAKSCYVQCFFHFWPFFHCRKATKMTQNSISIPSCAQTPKNPRKMPKTPPYSGLGAKPFLAPPAKADIATAILTNVIEHLVLLLPPNKHAFTAKAVWADFEKDLHGFIIGTGSPRRSRSHEMSGQQLGLIFVQIGRDFSKVIVQSSAHANRQMNGNMLWACSNASRRESGFGSAFGAPSSPTWYDSVRNSEV